MGRFRHGGNVWRIADETGIPADGFFDFSASINPLGPPDWLPSVVEGALDGVVRYPDPDCRALTRLLARRHETPEETILLGNGSAELLSVLPRAVTGRRAIVPVPAYVDYRVAIEAAGLEVVPYPLSADRGFRLDTIGLQARLCPGDLVVIGQPNNPTSLSVDPDELRAVAGAFPFCTIAVDEAFIAFTHRHAQSMIQNRLENVVVLRSFTKILAIPGLRLGYAVAAPELIARMRALLPPWSVNHLAQAVGVFALTFGDDLAGRTRAWLEETRQRLLGDLSTVPHLAVMPGEANFLLVRIDHPRIDADALADRLVTKRLLIRSCANVEGLGARYFRVAVRTQKENVALVEALRDVFERAV